MTPFYIEYNYKGTSQLAEIKPCCQEDDMFYYDVSINNAYQFTITPSSNNEGFTWRLALKNADRQVDADLIKLVGEQIDNYNMQ